MATFSLIPYSIRLRKSGDTDQYLKLGKEFNDAKIDLVEVLKDYFSKKIPSLTQFAQTLVNKQENQQANEEAEEETSGKQVFAIEDWKAEDSWIHGTFRTGEYGYSAPILHIETGDIAHTKSRLEAELSPYYFLVKITPNSEIGIVLLQAFNNQGIKDIFFGNLYDFFRSKHTDYIIEMSPFIPRGLVKEYLSNRIIEIRLVKFGYPSEIMDIPMDAMPEEEVFEGTSELIIKPPVRKDFPGKFLDRIRSKIDDFLGDSDSSISNLVEVKNFKYDTAKIKVKHGSSDRTVDLINTGRLKYSEELDGKVKIDPATGFPEFDSLDKLAKDFLAEIETTVWGVDKNE
jgi:hypothetical protein